MMTFVFLQREYISTISTAVHTNGIFDRRKSYISISNNVNAEREITDALTMKERITFQTRNDYVSYIAVKKEIIHTVIPAPICSRKDY